MIAEYLNASKLGFPGSERGGSLPARTPDGERRPKRGSKTMPGEKKRRSSRPSWTPVAVPQPLPLDMGDTCVVGGATTVAANADAGDGAELPMQSGAYMKEIEAAREQRRAEGVTSGDTRVSDGKRSLLTWYAPDAYAFAVICWEVLTLRSPWAGVGFAHVIFKKVQQGERPEITLEDEEGAPPGFVTFIRELWAQDPLERPTFDASVRRLTAMRKKQVKKEEDGSMGGDGGGDGQPRQKLDLVSDLFGGGTATDGPQATEWATRAPPADARDDSSDGSGRDETLARHPADGRSEDTTEQARVSPLPNQLDLSEGDGAGLLQQQPPANAGWATFQPNGDQ